MSRLWVSLEVWLAGLAGGLASRARWRSGWQGSLWRSGWQGSLHGHCGSGRAAVDAAAAVVGTGELRVCELG
eukprot:3794055-Pyramimonas_sp.AAC.1